MSNIRERAREVKAAGEAERGNFQPTGAPLNSYKYWLRHSKSKRARAVRRGDERENFCHFWRVVAIWAPLMFMRNKTTDFIASPYFILPTAGGLLGTFIYTLFMVGNVAAVTGVVFAILLAIAMTVVGIGGGLAFSLPVEVVERSELPEGREATWAFILGLPVAIPVFLVTRTARAIYDYRKYIAPPVAGLTILMALFSLGYGAFSIGWVNSLIAVGVVAAGAFAGLAGIVGISMLADYLAGKRKLELERQSAARQAYLQEHGHYPVTGKARKPSKVKKFFVGLGDFIVFAAQVVRVNKWKICPLVEVDKAA